MSQARLSFIAVLILGVLTGNAALSLDMYLPAFPAIASDFGVTEGDVQITMSTFLLGFAIGQIFYGPLADSLGRRVVVFSSLFLYGLVSLWCALSSSIDELSTIRLFQGLAGASGSVLGRAIIRDVYEGRELARAMSLLILVLTGAPMVAPLLGSLVLAIASWRAIFWTLAAYAIIWSLLFLVTIPETLPAERRTRLTLNDLFNSFCQILTHRKAMGYTLSTSLAFAGMFAYIAATPFLYMNLYGISPQEYALFFAANVGGMAAGSVLNRRLANTKSVPQLMRLWISVLILASVVLALNVLFGIAGVWGLAIPLFFYVGALSPLSANGISGTLQYFRDVAGTASSVFGFFQFGIGSLTGFIISLFSGSSALPMALLIGASALCSSLVFWLTNGNNKYSVDAI